MAIKHELTPAARAFLEQPRFAVIATVSARGVPQQAVVWYLIDGDTLIFNSKRGRKKDDNLAGNPRVSVCVEDGYRYITIRGQVEIVEDQAVAQADILRLATRYHGPEKAGGMARDQFSKEERLTYRLKLEQVSVYGFDE